MGASSSKESEWISVSDLMSGVVAVVVLLLVGATMARSLESLRVQVREEEDAKERLKVTRDAFESMEAVIRANPRVSTLVDVDAHGRIVTLKDATFRRGDACLKSGAPAVESIRAIVKDFLERNADAKIFVEGHTDSTEVKGVVRSDCGIFDDNFSLSALRAREVRRILVEGWGKDLEKRTAVAGYGPSQPLPKLEDDDDAQRRVEIRFVETERQVR